MLAMIKTYFFASIATFLLFAFNSQGNISKGEALAVINIFEQELKTPVRELFGTNFEIEFSADFELPNHPIAASADRSGNEWSISILAASRTHPDMTIDSFIILLCHELGHHFAGAPFKQDSEGNKRWASTEGQADYYATSVCAKRIFTLLPAPFLDSFSYPKDIKMKCQENTNGRKEAQICARAIIASQALIRGLSNRPHIWNSTDPSVASQTVGITPQPQTGQYQYPSDQCRMETLVKGALCQQLEHPSNQELLGTLGSKAFCQNGPFKRPACWYFK